jgi:hypothetical protein
LLYNHAMRKYLVFLIIVTLTASCSVWPFSKKKDAAAGKAPQTKGEKLEKLDEGAAAKPGDVKVIDGVEYIYASNRRYMLTMNEPEYVWIRKDQYSPRVGENILTGGPAKKEREDTEKRISKLEQDLRKKGIAPQVAYPTQMGSMTAPTMPIFSFNYPSPKMKRRIVVLPMVDQTNYKEEGLGEMATRRVISRLESTGAIICIDPSTINDKQILTEPSALRPLNELYGIQAVIKGTLSDVYTSSSKIEGKDEKETSFAMSRISLDVYNTDTGTLLKQFSGRNPISLTREKGDMSSEKAKIKAIDLAIEIVADDLLKSVLTLDWHARVASVEDGKVYLNAGRQSGLDKGSILEVYSPGEQIVDSQTNLPLGTIKGKYKGELEVSELFGVDASWAKVKKGSAFSATDLVYFQK